MTKNYEVALKEFLRFTDVVTIFASFYLAYYVRNSEYFAPMINSLLGAYLPLPVTPHFKMENLERILWLIVPLWLFLLSYSQTYSFQRTVTLLQILRGLFKVHIVGGLVIATYVFSTHSFEYKRAFFLMFIIFSLALTFLVRSMIQGGLRAFRAHGRNNTRAIIVGTGKKARELLSELQTRTYWGFYIVGLVSEGQVSEDKVFDLPVLGTVSELSDILRYRPVDDVFVATDDSRYLELKSLLKTCENIGINVHLIPDKYDLEIAQSAVGSLGDLEFITFFTVQNNMVQRFVKRVIDSSLALMLLPVLLVGYIIIGVLIKLDSSGPIFYKSLRITRNRRPFVIYKFRTMIERADEKAELLNGKNEMEGPITKIKDDPRVTRVGRALRRYSLDELPQIINVLMGDMSLVGPRPPTADEVGRYSLSQLRKLSMPQGMTGLWQVKGRDQIVNFDARLKLDLEYIDNWSLWLDMKILFKTFFVVFKGAM